MLIVAAHWKTIIAVSIIVFNILIKIVVKKLVYKIGYYTHTAEMEVIMVVTFLCQFFNTAFVMLLVNADLSE